MSDPTELVVRNLVTLRRLKNGLTRDVRRQVQALLDEIVAELAKIDPTAVSAERFRKGRVEKLLKRVEDLTGPAYREIRNELEAKVAKIGTMQATWAQAMLERTVGGVAIEPARGMGLAHFRSILKSNPFVGDTLRDWAERAADSTVTRIRRQIQIGMTQSETLDEIVRRIRGRSVGGGRFAGGVMRAAKNEVESIARTAITFIANEAHMGVYETNADILTGVEFTATLDSRTTLVCARWDGTVWDVDDDKKQVPPLHFGCRSVLTPVVDWKGLGIQPPPEGTRASKDGQVKASTTYAEWFSRQDPSVQDDIIGPARAQLFRDGKLTFRDMIAKDNRILTLAELER